MKRPPVWFTIRRAGHMVRWIRCTKDSSAGMGVLMMTDEEWELLLRVLKKKPSLFEIEVT